MIIKFGNFELSEWAYSTPHRYSSAKSFHRLYQRRDGVEVVGVSVREYMWARSIDPEYSYKCFAMFHHDFLFFDRIFPRDIDGDLEFAKECVDKFLIKMASLRAFV